MTVKKRMKVGDKVTPSHNQHIMSGRVGTVTFVESGDFEPQNTVVTVTFKSAYPLHRKFNFWQDELEFID